MTKLRTQVAFLVGAELRTERRSGEVALIVIPFGAIALLIIPMALGIETTLLARIGPGMFWAVVVLFGLTLTQRQTASMSSAHDDTLRLLGVDPAARFVATATATAALLLIFSVAAGLVTIILYDPALDGLAWAAIVIPLAAAGLAMVGTIAGSVAQGLGSRTTLAPLLAVPLSVPIVLGASQATEAMRQGVGILRWILLLALVDVLLAVAGVVTARPLEEAST